MSRYYTTWLYGAAGAVSLSLLATCAFADDAVTLRFKYVAGQVINYQTSGQMSMAMPNMGSKPAPGAAPQTINIPMNSTQKVHVLKIEPNGDARLEITTSTLITMPGAAPSGKPIVSTSQITCSPLGVIATGKPATATGAGAGLAAFSGIQSLGSLTAYLPTRPVKPGDSWTQTVAIPQMQEKAVVKGVYVKSGRIGRYNIAHIRLSVTVPVHSDIGMGAGSKAKAAGKGTLAGKIVMQYDDDFAIQEGRLIKTMGSGSVEMSFTQGGIASAGSGISTKVTTTSTMVQ